MNEQEAAKIIGGLREQVASMRETLDRMPPTVERAWSFTRSGSETRTVGFNSICRTLIYGRRLCGA